MPEFERFIQLPDGCHIRIFGNPSANGSVPLNFEFFKAEGTSFLFTLVGKGKREFLFALIDFMEVSLFPRKEEKT